MRVRVMFAIAGAAALFLAACGDAEEPETDSGAEVGGPVIVVDDAWVRATPEGTTTTGGFMVLTNEGDVDDELIRAWVPSDVAAEVQIHETVTGATSSSDEGMSADEMEDMGGMARMREITVLPIPAGGDVELAPGGYHLMFMDAATLEEGDTVNITLSFKESGDQEVEAEVRPL